MTSTAERLAAGVIPFLAAAACLAGASSAAAPPPVAMATGLDAGWPDVRGWDALGRPALQTAPWGFPPMAFAPYPTYQYGVRVAVGDVNGDGKAEIVTAPGKGAWTELRIFDGTTFERVRTVLPFTNAAWWNGAFVATADTNGDARAEIVDGLDAGCCTTIHVVDAATGAELSGFYPEGFRAETGTQVATADLNGDARAEILALPLGSSRVSAFGTAGGEPIRSYQAFGSEAVGGAAIAAGDVVGDSRPELVAAANTPSGVQINVIDSARGVTLASLHPYDAPAVATPRVAVGDVDGDGRGDAIVLAQLAEGTQLKALAADGRELGSFFVLDPGIVPGASLAAGDLDGDGTAEIVLGGGPTTTAPWPPVANGPDQRVVVRRLDGSLVASFTAYPGLFQGGVRVALADVEEDGRPAIVTAPGPGMEPEVGIYSQRWSQTRDRGTRLGHFLAYEASFTGGVSVASGYWAGKPLIVVAPGAGRAPEVRVFDRQGKLLSSFLAFEIVYTGGLSVAVGDLSADGSPEIVVGTLASPARIRAFDLGGAASGSLIAPFPADAGGVQVAVADVLGTGRGAIVAAEASGSDPLLALIDPATAGIVRSTRPASVAQTGLRVGSGDLDQDGRDEILVSAGFGGDGTVRVLGPGLQAKSGPGVSSFQVYTWADAGMYVAGAPRVGLPLRAHSVTARLVAGKRTRVVVGRFRDASGRPASSFRATIRWGDGTRSRGLVVRRGEADLVVRGTKRFAKRGVYELTVTLSDSQRTSVAHSRAVVRARRTR